MNKSWRHIAWAGIGLTITLTTGTPAFADDTELLLSTPNSTGADKPNILFILDTSGSMTTIEHTQQPFDKDNIYPGSCSSNLVYWTDKKSIPNCSSNNTIPIGDFYCAQGIAQMADAGSFTDTMAQYRRSRRRGYLWQRLSNSYAGPVECEDDSGKHGALIGNPDDVYARIGRDQSSMYSSNSNREVDWGSRPTERVYTVYSANYLNWFHNSPVTSMSRNAIVKAVTKNVLGSINNVNVGFMEFNFENGGSVTRAIKDLDSSRSAAIADINGLPASGWTPLSETLYESALYWHGKKAVYADSGDTDPAALATTSPMVYDKPVEYSCAKNFTVLLTDGEPTHDVGAYSKVASLPNWAATTGTSACVGGNVDGSCLDDISEYLSKQDINPDIPGDQTVTTHTIGFKADFPLLKNTAEISGGTYHLAEDVGTLTTALTEIVTSIFDKDISFTAPAVSVNAFNRTQHLNDLYISVFRATTGTHWPGNMKKYTIDSGVVHDSLGNPAVDPNTGFFANTAHSFWTPPGKPDGASVLAGGAVSQLPDPSSRKVYSNLNGNNLSAAANHLSTSNLSALSLSDFGLSGLAGEPTLPDLVEWIRGVDVRDIDNDPLTTERRQMGDTLHSQPASIVYGVGSGTNPTTEIVVYTATNDGQLHAIDGQTGEELWVFMPKEMLPGAVDLFYDENINYKQYGIDGNIVPIVFDRNENGNIEVGTDSVYLVFGLRRGGNNYYALDVTNKNAPKLKWIRSYAGMGQSWSTPVPARIKVTNAGATGTDDAVLVVGGGYDTVHDQAAHPSSADAEGAGIFVLDLETGNELWRAGADPSADLTLPKMTRAIPSSVRILDMNGNGFADRMYAADLGGQVWRFDITSGKNPAALVAGGVIARLGAEGQSNPGLADTRRFYSTPDIAMFMDYELDKRFLSISLGSGYRAHPLDKSTTDRFYSIRDPDVFVKLSQTAYNNYSIIYDSNLIEVSGKAGSLLTSADRGWKFTLPPDQKILAESRTFDDNIYFVSFEPDVASADPCQAGLSVNRLYRVKIKNGDPVTYQPGAPFPTDPDEIDDQRVTQLEQGGIAVRPIFLFPSPVNPNCQGEECSPPPVGCVGVECFDPGFANNPVRTLWTQDGIN